MFNSLSVLPLQMSVDICINPRVLVDFEIRRGHYMRISEKKTILNYVLNALLALSVIPKHTYFSSTCPNLNFIVKTFFNTLQSFVKWRGGSLF